MPEQASDPVGSKPTPGSGSGTLRRKLPLYIGITLLVIGVVTFYTRLDATNGTPELPNAVVTITENASEPSERKPDSNDTEFTVPDDQPRSIRIPNIGANGLVQKVGILKDNSMAAPTNVHFAGWYVRSVKPGQPGLSIIDGHVSGKYADGIFKRLDQVKPEDSVEVEFGDRTIRRFKVVEVKKLKTSEASSFLFLRRSDITEQLNLITCGGAFDKSSQQYSERVIVVSRKI